MKINIEIPDNAPYRLVSIQHRAWNEAWTVFLTHTDYCRSHIAYGFATKYDINEAFAEALAMFHERDKAYDELKAKENADRLASSSSSILEIF